MKSTFIFSFLALFILPFILRADVNQAAFDNFTKADELYKKGDYNRAIDLYNEIIDNGYDAYQVYYNLGNAYFKSKKIPQAILNFERAKRLAPDDEDVNFNLIIANLRIVDKIDPVPKFFLSLWLEDLQSMFSSGTWSRVVIIFFWIAFISLTGFFLVWTPFLKKLFFGIAIIGFVLTISTFIFAFQEHKIEQARNYAIIFSPNVYIKSSPDEKGTDLFILHEGAKVQILDTVGEWKKIKLANGNVGWLPENTFEII